MRGRGCRLGTLPLLILMALHGVAAAGIDEDWKKAGPSVWSTDSLARLIGWKDAFGKSIAVVIGVGEYDHFARLSAPAADALRVRDFLRDEAGFDRIITITDEIATRVRIESLMERVIPALVGPNDRFLFYFSGHGATRQLPRRKRGYLALKSSKLDEWDDMIDMERVKSQWAENVAQARHTLFLLDACFSGLAAFEAKGDVAEKTIERLMQPGHHIVTAGTEGEKSFIYDEKSLFTQAFLAAARGEGMAPGDGVVSLSEMMTRVNRAIDRKRVELRDQIKMTPRQYYSWTDNNAGEFFFLPRAATTIAVAPLPRFAPGAIVPKSPETDGTPLLPGATTAFRIFDGAVASGNAVQSFSSAGTFGECYQRCSRTAGCRTFSFNRSSNACHLYSDATLAPNTSFDSGTRDPIQPR